MRYGIDEEVLTSMADIIRDAKGVEDKYTPTEMVDEFQDIADNSVPEEEKYVIRTAAYKYANNNFLWHYNRYGLIQQNKSTAWSYVSVFDSCTNLKRINNIDIKPNNINHFFYYCTNLEEFDWDTVNIDTSVLNTSTNNCAYMFSYCYKLRYIKPEVLRTLYTSATTSSSASTYYGFYDCRSLDEIRKAPLTRGTVSSGSSLFNSFVTNCYRLKTLTFDTNDDGTPLVLKFKGATLDLSSQVGYGTVISHFTDNGFTTATQIKDATTYAALKDNPDSWTISIAYCRYNKDSALETIQSLPDTSAYGTNTIKFKKTAGSSTDGGAINTLTADEIAIATAKGWTVTFAT